MLALFHSLIIVAGKSHIQKVSNDLRSLSSEIHLAPLIFANDFNSGLKNNYLHLICLSVHEMVETRNNPRETSGCIVCFFQKAFL